MSQFIIRQVVKEDAKDLVQLMKNYIVDFYQKPEPKEEDVEALIHRLIMEPSSGIQFVAEKEEKLVGFATLYFSFSTLQLKKVAILNDMFINEDARGEKIGEQLFQTSLSYIRENDFAYMTWETAKDNLIAQSLYNKMGGKISEWLVYEMS
ncbi:GNAT family N-acetyltransferase [Anaerobacillus alkaliphilus]|uniref:GNAT family N-acetyltransferase n=1 Tax=Anaerobacillus alkaliphilus TaxID=1548597 RepID=A0A4Q0VR36_9BACI|nr:GNAT family N-acetyltransferase [Anaerobacillus alkaliphilus]RXI98591.1 GNAT family N-acetyltransferase [Anaerobacillus alkaliphilus]